MFKNKTKLEVDESEYAHVTAQISRSAVSATQVLNKKSNKRLLSLKEDHDELMGVE
jgi:hypothetical protein